MRHILLTTLSLAFLAVCGSVHAQGSFGTGNTYTGFGPTGFSSPAFGGAGFTYVSTSRYSPPAKFDPRLDPSMVRAAKIADQRSGRRSKLKCWRYVKDALVDAGAVHSRPTTTYASQAGDELTKQHGFVKLATRDPYRAPIGAVIVYGGHGAGHVELRTAHGFASDYHSTSACRYRVIGVYAKVNS